MGGNKVDILIIGQGLAGTLLSWQLLSAGKKVLVIDQDEAVTASKVSSGVMNPVTGKRLLPTWEWETLLPAAIESYLSLEKLLNISILTELSILDFFENKDSETVFEERVNEELPYLHGPSTGSTYTDNFNFNFGVGEIHPCYQVDVKTLLNAWQLYLKNTNAYLSESFSIKEAFFTKEKIEWKGYEANQIIFCNGADAVNNPWFGILPFAGNKGEALIISIPNLPREAIYRHGLSLVPFSENLFWFGSSFEPIFEDLLPSHAFKEKGMRLLDSWLKTPYEIIDHICAERASMSGQRPVIGFHPIAENIGIFNGLGAKGCSLAPYFANQFCNHIVDGTPIDQAVGLGRYHKMLNRS